MTALSRGVIFTCCFLILTGCASNVGPQWRHFQGDLAGQGYLPVESGFALSSAWIAGPYNIINDFFAVHRNRYERQRNHLYRYGGWRAGGH